MAGIRWTKRAYDEFEGVFDYIARDSPSAARAITEAIYHAIQRLRAYPSQGRLVVELQGEYRELIVRSYRVIYRVEDDSVVLTAILHGRRHLDPTEFR